MFEALIGTAVVLFLRVGARLSYINRSYCQAYTKKGEACSFPLSNDFV